MFYIKHYQSIGQGRMNDTFFFVDKTTTLQCLSVAIVFSMQQIKCSVTNQFTLEQSVSNPIHMRNEQLESTYMLKYQLQPSW